MKKKQPTLTHYTKRLKKVRLARTITVIATLFVSAVVVAANVLPQVIKSNAAVVPDTTNDVLAGGVNQYNGDTAKSELVAKVINGTSNEAKSAKALYAKFGIGKDQINGATFKWLYGPNVTGTKVTPNESILTYGDWNSFGRRQNVDPGGVAYTLFQVAYSATAPAVSPADFYYKPHKIMFPGTWSQGKSAEPVLMGNGWFIALECGNIVVKTIPPTPVSPKIGFEKKVIRVTRAGKVIDSIDVKTFKILKGDNITYRLSGANTGDGPKASLRIADSLPAGTSWVAQGDPANGWKGVSITLESKTGPTSFPDGTKGFAWKFGVIPAGVGGDLDYTVKVDTVTPQICNFAYWSAVAGGGLEGASNTICMKSEEQAPLLEITKTPKTTPASIKVGDQLSYDITLTNKGTAAATNALALDILKKDAANAVTSQGFVSLGAAKVTKIDDGSTVTATTHSVTNADNNASQDKYANGNHDAYGYQVDSLAAGTRLTFTITVKAIVLPEACDFAIGNYKDSGNPIAIVKVSPNPLCTPVVDEKLPHITVVKTSPTSSRKVARGQVINYDIVVKNTSAKAAQTSEVTVTDTFTPPGYAKNLKQSSSSNFTGLSISNTQQTDGFVWKIAKIPANGVVTIKVSATVADTAAEGDQFCNNANITMTPTNTVISETSSRVCNPVTLIKQTKSAKYVNRSDDPQKSPANAGDKIEYTLTTTNQATAVAKDYIVTEDLSDVLSYADLDLASTGGATLTDGKLTWPVKDIPAGGSITNTFIVTVKNPVPNNEPSASNPGNYDYNMYNFYGNDVNIKVNKPLIQQIVDVATNLPETGAASYALVVLFLGMSVYFFVRNKQLTSELAAATVEYQHQESAGALTQAQNLIHPEEPDVTTPEPPAAPPAV